MISAIVYTSNTGTTKEYAAMLGEKLNLPVYELASCNLEKNTEIIYLGWLMASEIKGYKKANKKYNIKLTCAVGMGETGTQIPEIRKRNKIDESAVLYSLQGGFFLDRLTGIYKFMMTIMKLGLAKGLEEKPDRTHFEDEMLDLVKNGGSRVSEENLKEVTYWYNENK